jgi:S1-C subfamily serine protease
MTMRKIAVPLFAALLFGPAGGAVADPAGESKTAGYLGVHLQPIQGGLAEALDRAENDGVLVGQVEDDSPAAQAGLKSGDILLAIGDEKMGSPDDVRKAVRGLAAGDVAQIRYVRDGKTQTARATLGEAPRNRARFGPSRPGRIGGGPEGEDPHHWGRDLRFGGERGFFGVTTQPVNGDLAAYFGVKGEGGALVAEVVEDSPAAKLGLKAGDVITSLAGQTVDGPDGLRRIVRDFEEAAKVEVVWTRDKKEKKGEVELELRDAPLLGFGGERNFDFHFPDMDGIRRSVNMQRFDRDELDDTLAKLREELDELRQEVQSLREAD